MELTKQEKETTRKVLAMVYANMERVEGEVDQWKESYEDWRLRLSDDEMINMQNTFKKLGDVK